MEENVIKYFNKLRGFRSACKNLHFSASNLNEHEFFDKFDEILRVNEDELCEIYQGVNTKFDKTTIDGEKYTIESSKKFVQDVISSTIEFCKSLTDDKYIGLKSCTEGFLEKLDKQPYLLDLCLKEDFKRSYKSRINESDDAVLDYFRKLNQRSKLTPYSKEDRERNFGAITRGTPEERNPSYAKAKAEAEKRKQEKQMRNETVKLTEKEFKSLIDEAVNNVLNGFINEIGDTPKGQFALGAVRGRSAARPRYQNKEFNSVPARAKQERIGNMAGDEAWKERANQGGFNNPNREKMNQQYGQGYDYGYKKGMTEAVDENCQTEAEVQGGMYKDKELNFTHFAVNKATGLIVDGWDYSGYDSEDLKSDKNGYFFNDLKENGFNPKAYTVWPFKYCQKKGIDPNNDKQYWSNTGVYPLQQEMQMKQQGVNPYEQAQSEHPDWFIA